MSAVVQQQDLNRNERLGTVSPNYDQFEITGLTVTGEMIRRIFPCGQQEVLAARDEALLRTGSQGSIWFIDEGWLFVLRSAADGRLKTGELLGTGDLVGLAGLWTGGVRSLPVYTLTEVHAYRIPGKTFEEECCHNPELSHAVMSYMSERYRRMASELFRATLLPLTLRIQSFLDYAAVRLRDEGGLERLNLTQTIVAWAVGAHPVSVSRAMKELHHRSLAVRKWTDWV